MSVRDRPRVTTIRKPRGYVEDNSPLLYSTISFDPDDCEATFRPRLGHDERNQRCHEGAQICHDCDTWLSRESLIDMYRRNLLGEGNQ